MFIEINSGNGSFEVLPNSDPAEDQRQARLQAFALDLFAAGTGGYGSLPEQGRPHALGHDVIPEIAAELLAQVGIEVVYPTASE